MLNATSRHAISAMTTESVNPPPANPAPTPIENARPTPGPMVVTDWNNTPLVLTALWTSAWPGSAVLIHFLPLDVIEERKGGRLLSAQQPCVSGTHHRPNAVCRFSRPLPRACRAGPDCDRRHPMATLLHA